MFAQDIDWTKLDVTTFSWQKVLGGEAQHGMLILSPRAVDWLDSFMPPWPLPKLFRLTRNGRLMDDLFEGSTINTPSMLCLELSLRARLRRQLGRARRHHRPLRRQRQSHCRLGRAHAVGRFCRARLRRAPIPRPPQNYRSRCAGVAGEPAYRRAAAHRGAARCRECRKDIASHRLAPPGLRIWSWRHGGAERCQSVDAVARLGLRAVKQSLDIAA